MLIFLRSEKITIKIHTCPQEQDKDLLVHEMEYNHRGKKLKPWACSEPGSRHRISKVELVQDTSSLEILQVWKGPNPLHFIETGFVIALFSCKKSDVSDHCPIERQKMSWWGHFDHASIHRFCMHLFFVAWYIFNFMTFYHMYIFYNHCHIQDTELFIQHNRSSSCYDVLARAAYYSLNFFTTDLFSISITLSFWESWEYKRDDIICNYLIVYFVFQYNALEL